MKKLSLIATLLLTVLLLQKCKKDTVSASTTSNTLLFAVINDTSWNADTVNAAITYNSIAKTKVFNCSAIAKNKELKWSVTQTTNVLNTAGFPLTTFNADSANGNSFSYYTSQKNSSGVFVLAPLGTVSGGSGNLTVTAVDSVKKTITGTFSFTAKKFNYDDNGNVISVTISQIIAGAFNNMPYTFNSN
ncbi:MAG TPA: hypothetical protein VIM16_06695 [Mucilaginibacter sp.]|jgi:hypothetical protein